AACERGNVAEDETRNVANANAAAYRRLIVACFMLENLGDKDHEGVSTGARLQPNAAAISAADCHRAWRSFATARLIAAARSGGTSLLKSASSGGLASRCICSTSSS